MIPRIIKRVVKYAIIGGVAGIISYGLLFFLVEEMNFKYVNAIIFSYLIAHSVNYLLNRSFTFTETKRNKSESFLMFMIFGSFSLVLIVGITTILTELFGIHYIYSRFIASPIAGIINFSLNYFFSFDMKKHFKGDLKFKR